MLEIRDVILLTLLSLVLTGVNGEDKPCLERWYNHSSVVCVCNAYYCDEVSKVVPQPPGSYVMYSSTMSGQRFFKTYGNMDPLLNWIRKTFTFAIEAVIEVNRDRTYQSIIGFGGSFSDSTGINVDLLSEGAKNNFIKSYFSNKGLEYNVARVPIGGSDFSTHPYAYNELPLHDKYLTNYSLSEEDYRYKIPFIKKALKASGVGLQLMASAWSPPPWMKSNHEYGGESRLLPEYYQTWANYHLKFLQEYSKEDIEFWSITTGNEPTHGWIPILASFNSLGWIPPSQAKWIAENLGPTIRASQNYPNMKILALDDQRYNLPWWIEWMALNKDTMQYIDGIAVHWYWNDLFGTETLDRTHRLFPDKFLIATEAATNDRPWNLEKVELGSWTTAEMYITDIMEDLNHWFTGWLDWNLALNREGGPNWFDNKVNAAIIVMPENDEFLKQPLFYAIGHFSKFIPRGSKRVHVKKIAGFLDHVVFLRPDNGTTVVICNLYDTDRIFTIQDKGKGRSISINIPPRSIHSLIYY